MTYAIHRKIALQYTITCLLLLLLPAVPTWALDDKGSTLQNENALFEQANQYYAKGDFNQAITLYQRLNANYESGNLYYNMGNAYFKMGQKGRAILYFEKARRLIPGDAGLKANLALALTGVDEGEINWTREFFQSLAHLMPLNQLTLISSVFLWLLLLLLVFLVLLPSLLKNEDNKRIKLWYRSILLFVACLLLGAVSLTAHTYLDQRQLQAVAVKNNTPVLGEPVSTGTAYYHLAEGSRIVINDIKDDWYLIKRQDGKRGWVEGQYLELF